MKSTYLRLVPALVVTLVFMIHMYNATRDGLRHYLLRKALVHPKLSPWRRLLSSGDEKSFLDLTGFDFVTFRELVHIIATNDEIARRRRVGRPKLLNVEDELGIFLFYLNSTMRSKHLAVIFGVLPGNITETVKRLMKRTVKALRNYAEAKVSFPTVEIMRIYADMIQDREPTVDDVIGFLDGVSIPIQCSDYPEEQAMFYNGYHCDTMINNIFLFAPNGKITYSVFNAPGSWHDSHVAQPLVSLVVERIGMYKICVDQGFQRSGILFNKFVGPLSKKTRRNLSPILRRVYIEQHNKYISLRQCSEWGMRSLQGSFSRLKSRLTSNSKERYLILYSIILLHNLRTARIGLNQIATVFNAHYEQYINIEGYDRVARYYDQL